MALIPMRRQGSHLAAVDELSAEELRNAMPDGGDCMVTITFPRSLRQLRLWWALCTKLAEMVDWIMDKEHASDLLKLKIKHVHTIVLDESGAFEVIPASISFTSLKQDKFNRIFNRAIHIITTEIVPGLDEPALRREIEEMIT